MNPGPGRPGILAALPILVLVIGFDVVCLADLARTDRVRAVPKWVWAVIICLSSPWGGLLYLFYGKVREPAAGISGPVMPTAPGLPRRAAVTKREETSPVDIEVEGLIKRFGAVTALDGLSFVVRAGHVTGFLGPNGAGKTTTMRIILGLVAPTSGTALIGGRRYRDIIRPLHHVGALLDATEIHQGRTGRLHLLSIAQSNGIASSRVDEVLALTGLDTVASRPAGVYSLGMKQRLGIAAALLGDPGVLLFDEPINGLDPEGVLWVRALFRSLAAEGRLVLVSSHLMSEMAQTADHLIIIGRGRLLTDAPTDQFIEANARKDVLVRSPRAGDLAELLTGSGAVVAPEGDDGIAVTGMGAPAIGDLAASRGIPVHALIPRHASLEDAYLDLTGTSTDYRAGSAGTRASQ